MHSITGGTDTMGDDLLSLLDAMTERAQAAEEPDDDLSPAERFQRFHEDNPAVYQAMVTLARQWVARTGRRKLGINALIERVRWEIAIRTTDPYLKINNNFAPFYSRLIMRQEPDLADLFDVRRSAADEWIGGRAA